MESNKSDLAYTKAKNRVEKEKGFYVHLYIYVIVNIMITGFKVSGSLRNWDNFINRMTSIDVLSSWVIWGVFIILHFIAFKYGHDWEERKIKQLMDEELSNNSYN